MHDLKIEVMNELLISLLFPFFSSHGTRCAGEVSAVADNNVCGVGIAYHSKIAGKIFSFVMLFDKRFYVFFRSPSHNLILSKSENVVSIMKDGYYASRSTWSIIFSLILHGSCLFIQQGQFRIRTIKPNVVILR